MDIVPVWKHPFNEGRLDKKITKQKHSFMVNKNHPYFVIGSGNDHELEYVYLCLLIQIKIRGWNCKIN